MTTRVVVFWGFLALAAGCAATGTSPPRNAPDATSTHDRAPEPRRPSPVGAPEKASAGRESDGDGARRDTGTLAAEQRASRPAALDVPGFERAVLSFPSAERAREPVLVVAHGAGVVPADQCGSWREVLGDRGILLCIAGPRTSVHDEGRYFPDHFALERIAFASLDAFRNAFPDVAGAEQVVYAGYSQGATMGALMIVEHGATCPRLILVEGGFDGWTLTRARTYAAAGGQRVLFVCGTRRCSARARTAAETLIRAGVAAKVVTDLSAGHTYGGGVARALEDSVNWLFEGDPDWR